LGYLEATANANGTAKSNGNGNGNGNGKSRSLRDDKQEEQLHCKGKENSKVPATAKIALDFGWVKKLNL
jgi:hypothetical protein